MIYSQSETYSRPKPIPRAETGPFRSRLTAAGNELLSAILARNNCYVHSEEAPLRYRLLTDTALRLAEQSQAAAYFDLTSLAYQYDLTAWVQNNVNLLAIQLNLPLPDERWWQAFNYLDPLDYFTQFLQEYVLMKAARPVMLSFDEVDALMRAPLAADFFRLVENIRQAQDRDPDFARLTMVFWGQRTWQRLAENGRLPLDALKVIVL